MSRPAHGSLRPAVGPGPSFVPLPAIPPRTDRDVLQLAANTAKSLPVPAGARYARILATDAELYVAYDATAAVPVSDILDGTAPDLNPEVIDLSAADGLPAIAEISVICPRACRVWVAWGV